MKKDSKIEIAIHAIVLVTFNIIVYLISKWDFTTSQIISYAIMNVAYIIFAFTPSIGKSENHQVEIKTPLIFLATLYMVAIFITGIVSMVLFKENYYIPTIIYILIHAIYAIALLIVVKDNNRIIESEQKKK